MTTPDATIAVERAAEAMRAAGIGGSRVLIVMGSGLAAAARSVVEPRLELPFEEVPGVAAASVEGHEAVFLYGEACGIPVLAMLGRSHLYEGLLASVVALPVRAARLLGCEAMIATNAAGGLRHDLARGTVMLVTDHLNLTGQNPLTGENIAVLGPRFPSMADAYSPRLAAFARESAEQMGMPLPEGVYAGVPGPSYETSAETHMLRMLGADAVGMSTVTEVIAARHAGMEVAALSVITNRAGGGEEPGGGPGGGAETGRDPRARTEGGDVHDDAGDQGTAYADHKEVLERAAAATPLLSGLLQGILTRLRS